jgi:hypothetical protein
MTCLPDMQGYPLLSGLKMTDYYPVPYENENYEIF